MQSPCPTSTKNASSVFADSFSEDGDALGVYSIASGELPMNGETVSAGRPIMASYSELN